MTKIINASCGGIPDITNGVGHSSVRVNAILTQDDAGLYAVYVAIVRNETDVDREMRNAENVARLGRKLSWEKARFFFPTLSEREYRA